MKPLISIIVPIYNCEKYVKRCIDSIINQTYKELEIILIDDGSTDNSLDVINEYRKSDSRIKVFSHPNSGVSYTRNFGIGVANGKYLSFVDSDDILDLGLYETFYKILEIHKDSDLIQCGYNVFNDPDLLVDSKFIPEHLDIKSVSENDIYSNQLNIMNLRKSPPDMIAISVWAKLYLSSIIKENNIRFREDLHMFEDGIFTIQYLNFTKKACLIKEKLYYYRVMPNNSLTQKMDVNKLEQNLICMECLKKFFVDRGIDYNNEEAFIHFSFGSIMSYFKAYLFHKNCNLNEHDRKAKFKSVYNNQDFVNSIRKIDRKCLPDKYRRISLLIKLKKYYFIRIYYILKRYFPSI